jgi:translocator protein
MDARARIDDLTHRLAEPSGAFHAAWSLSYAGQAVGAWLVWRSDAARGEYDVPALTAYGTQLFLGVVWALLFFGFRRPALALAEGVVLWIAVTVTVGEFARRHRFAAALLLPYLGWTTYALIVNGAAWWDAR